MVYARRFPIFEPKPEVIDRRFYEVFSCQPPSFIKSSVPGYGDESGLRRLAAGGDRLIRPQRSRAPKAAQRTLEGEDE